MALGAAIARPEETCHDLFAGTVLYRGRWPGIITGFSGFRSTRHDESVEVASREPDRDGRDDVWVWFTEHADSKRQIHYRNSALLAGFVGGQYRPIYLSDLGR